MNGKISVTETWTTISGLCVSRLKNICINSWYDFFLICNFESWFCHTPGADLTNPYLIKLCIHLCFQFYLFKILIRSTPDK